MKKKINAIICLLLGFISGRFVSKKIVLSQLNKIKEYSDKHLMLFLMMNQWVKIKQEGVNLSEYFERKNYNCIAIYGMSYVGQTLVRELEKTEIKVAYGIDRNSDNIYSNIHVVSMKEPLEKVDAVVVTAVRFFDEIEKELHERIDCPIISIEDILFEY